MLRALGHKSTDYLRNELESALRRFPSTQLVPVVFDCITLTDVTSRLGAVRVLESMPAIEALGQLCEAIHDTDRNIRLSAAHALRKRADIRACVALMAHLNDENNEVRIAVNQAIIRILKTANVRSIPVRKIVLEPFNISLCAEEVISPDCIQEFEGIGNPLVCLAEACVKSDRPLPEILNAIDALTITKENSPMRVSVTIVISLSLIFAKVMREKKRLKEAIGIYSNATTLAKQIHSPHLEWRAWYAIGECFEILGDDVNAWKAFRNAMETIDRQWFALLEEDKPRYFFQDKARLYDQAVLCCLRLGHNALALECLEKSKTRYLGDIIARGQMNTLLALNQEIREFWKDIGSLRSVDGSVDSSQTIDNSEVEIVAVEWGNANIGTRVIKPKHRSVFEKISQDREEHKVKNYILKRLWQLMSNIATENNGRLS
jgi:tetratricopeptide (TPR) repeat protein